MNAYENNLGAVLFAIFALGCCHRPPNHERQPAVSGAAAAIEAPASSAAAGTVEPDPWEGAFEFSENCGKDPGGVETFVEHRLVLRQQGNVMSATLEADGLQTMTRLICTASKKGNNLLVHFQSTGPDNTHTAFKPGALLLTLSAQEGKLRTTWNDYAPSCNESAPAGTYFVKVAIPSATDTIDRSNAIQRSLATLSKQSRDFNGHSTEGGTMTVYFDKKIPKHADVLLLGEVGKVRYQCFNLGPKHFYVRKTSYQYARPISEGPVTIVSQKEERYIVQQAKVYSVQTDGKSVSRIDDETDDIRSIVAEAFEHLSENLK